ncbi:ATP-dependent helicase [Filomicrobium sp.]|uniref:UvrD-helicase domain-containing protein n=1 Tax=Filomicrobium sp. TaxID=2024831 RepID=UPI0025839F39|nr:ATP-dependent helicase [Filomicrobium sp.]MCV0371839.1 ATP-dependent helicase [Filomicrobium sp.]
MELTDKQKEIMEAQGPLLVTGGPGSGKTTVSILKAAQLAPALQAGQKVLFLSFARATVSRVVEAIEYEQDIPPAIKRLIEVETYHSFFWQILKSHGYLIGLPRRLHILTPPGEAIELSALRSGFPRKGLSEEQKEEQKQAKKLAESEARQSLAAQGHVCFDLYAPLVGDLLEGSVRLRRLVAQMFPVIILDEFQDTNIDQWRVVKAMGENSTLIALADPEQRIYDWIGADPERLDHFREAFTPTEVDLSTDNHRSAGTDIAKFGNDVLTGNFRQAAYSGVIIDEYNPFGGIALTKLVTTIYAARQRLIGQDVKNWSIAILVPTKDMTRLVSDALRTPPGGMPAIVHNAVIEMDAAILGAELIAWLLQPHTDESRHLEGFIELVCNYYRGKGGGDPTKAALDEADKIRAAYDDMVARLAADKPMRKKSIIAPLIAVYEQARAVGLKGIPDEDWKAVRRVLEDGGCTRLKEAGEQVRYLRVLDRGMQLRQQLSEDWRENGAYANALTITRQAFLQEHFSTNSKPETGVVVMNMHKAKGKQFDEVIIFEHWPSWYKGKIVANRGRIVRSNEAAEITDQARQNFRVSITRGKRVTTILTPAGDRCVLLP